MWKVKQDGNETGSILDKMRSGTPAIISPQGSRDIKPICLRNCLSVVSITSIYNTDTFRNVSVTKVQNIKITILM